MTKKKQAEIVTNIYNDCKKNKILNV